VGTGVCLFFGYILFCFWYVCYIKLTTVPTFQSMLNTVIVIVSYHSIVIRPARKGSGPSEWQWYDTTMSYHIISYVINAWNGLPTAVHFRTLAALKRTLSNANLSPYLKRY